MGPTSIPTPTSPPPLKVKIWSSKIQIWSSTSILLLSLHSQAIQLKGSPSQWWQKQLQIPMLWSANKKQKVPIIPSPNADKKNSPNKTNSPNTHPTYKSQPHKQHQQNRENKTNEKVKFCNKETPKLVLKLVLYLILNRHPIRNFQFQARFCSNSHLPLKNSVKDHINARKS